MSPSRRRAAAAAGLFLALLGLYVLTSPGRIDMIDGQFRYEVARNWLDHGRPVILDRTLVPIGLSVMTPHGVFAVYNAAASVTPMPLMLLSRALPGHTVERERFFFAMTGPVLGAALGAVLVVAYGMLGLSVARAVGWALVACLATLWWPGSTTIFDQNQHALWLVLALVLAWESSRRQRVWPAVLGGLAGAALLNYQESYALVLPLVGLAVASTAPAERGGDTRLREGVDRASVVRYVAFGLACALGLAGFAGYNYLRFGALAYAGRYYDPLIFGWRHPVAALVGLFLSPGKSAFLFSPPLVLGLLGARRLFGRAPGLAVAVAGASIVHVLLIAQLTFFGGDWCWGPRYLLPLIPLWGLAFPFAAAWVGRRTVAALVGAGLLVQGAGLALDHQRFFLERNLAPHFWAVDPWFYVRHSQLLARFGELWSTARQGVPPEATFWSPTPRREVTYSLFGLPPGRHGHSSTWMRRFQVFYRPRPWPLWVSTLEPVRQPIAPAPWLLFGASAIALGAGIAWRAARDGGREEAGRRKPGPAPEGMPEEAAGAA